MRLDALAAAGAAGAGILILWVLMRPPAEAPGKSAVSVGQVIGRWRVHSVGTGPLHQLDGRGVPEGTILFEINTPVVARMGPGGLETISGTGGVWYI